MCHDQCWVNAFLTVNRSFGTIQTRGEWCQRRVEGEIHWGIIEGALSLVQITSIIQSPAYQHYVCL